MSAGMTKVTLGTVGPFGAPEFKVFTPYATALLDWFTTGKERTHTFRGMAEGRIGDDADRPVDITVSRDHLAFIFTEADS